MKLSKTYLMATLLTCLGCLHGCGDDSNNTPQGGDVTVLAPNGGETLKVGQPYSIRWECIASINDVTILLSKDGGQTWMQDKISDTTDSDSADWKNLSWSPTSDQVCDNCIIRISDYNAPTVFDASDNTFNVEQ